MSVPVVVEYECETCQDFRLVQMGDRLDGCPDCRGTFAEQEGDYLYDRQKDEF